MDETRRTPEEAYEEIVRLLETAPRATDAEMSVAKTHTQFGNNFCLLFISMQRDDPEDVLVECYLEPARALGDPWTRFVSNNGELIGKIFEALKAKIVYGEILSAFGNILKSGSEDLLTKIQALNEDMESVGVAAWSKLNPLLAEAAEKMREEGIQPEEFFS